MHSEKKILIAGGGPGGMVAGIYALKAGLPAVIYEKNPVSGGECTGWNRNGFHIDGCIHWLAGTKKGRAMNRIWEETGALDGVEIYQPESFTAVLDGKTDLHIWRDLDRLRKHLLEVSPQDKAEIEELADSVKAFRTFEPPVDKPADMMNIFEKLKFLFKNRKVIGRISKYSRLTVREYKKRFASKLISTAFDQIVPETYSAYSLFFTLAAFAGNNAGIPSGGSRAFAQRLEDKFVSLGGQIRFNNAVEEIIIEDGIATGLRLSDGSVETGDFIVTACDPAVVFNKLLKGKFVDEEFQKRYENPEAYPLQSCVYASFSVDADLSSLPGNCLFAVDGIEFEGRKIEKLSAKHFCHEPSFSPAGKSLMVVYLAADYDWWKSLYSDDELYRKEKSRLAKDIACQLELRFPKLAGKTEPIDMATPVTYERYCGAYRGSWLAFGNTPQSEPLRHNGQVDGIDRLYMTGQWFMPPGGLPAAAITGKWTIRRIMKDIL